MNQSKIFINSRGERLNRKAFEYYAMHGVVVHSLGLNLKVMYGNTKNKQATEPQQLMPPVLSQAIEKFMLWDSPDQLKFRLFNILHHAISSTTIDEHTAMDRCNMFNDIQCIYDLIDAINITYTNQNKQN